MSLDRRSRKLLLWVSRAARGVAIAMGVYILFNWDIFTIEDVIITLGLITIGAVAKAFSL